ncbi:MAG: hypothetical protein LBQ90_06810 [Synergistaceae bacterium]|jgi:hypothetical protein|nr:hypothetical protein [Synergistaceae bacterium]
MKKIVYAVGIIACLVVAGNLLPIVVVSPHSALFVKMIFGGMALISFFCIDLFYCAWTKSLSGIAQAFGVAGLLFSILLTSIMWIIKMSLPVQNFVVQTSTALVVALACLLLAETQNQAIRGRKKLLYMGGIIACLAVMDRMIRSVGGGPVYFFVLAASMFCVVLFLLAWAARLSRETKIVGILALILGIILILRAPNLATNRQAFILLCIVCACLTGADTRAIPAESQKNQQGGI